jgi:Kef-type K+ transport system membrane component KefB
MTTSSLYGILAIISFVLIWVFAALAFVFTKRAMTRTHVTARLGIGVLPATLRKLRKRLPLTDEELTLARQVLDDRGSMLALAIPATLFFLGCFYVFGSLEQLHGRTPSERTFLGVFPMVTSTNMAIQVLRSARLRRRVRPRV